MDKGIVNDRKFHIKIHNNSRDPCVYRYFHWNIIRVSAEREYDPNHTLPKTANKPAR